MNKEPVRPYYHFNGGDVVTWINGRIKGNIERSNKKLDGDLKGDFGFELTRFESVDLFPKHALGVAAYCDDKHNCSYEVFLLYELKSYETETETLAYHEDDYIHDKVVYDGKLITPMTPVPEKLKYMSDECFQQMVKEVRAAYTKFFNEKRSWLPKEEDCVNTMSNRIYYWVLKQEMTKE